MQQPERGGSAGRLAFLDALRGVAALAVMVHHACDFLQPAVAGLFNFGRFGTTLFFLCSGFIIPMSLARHSLRTFWINRFLRLYPLYWCSLGAALVLAAVSTYRLPDAFRTDPVATVALNATMIQFFLGVPDAQINYWTLAFELLFYASISALVALRVARAAPAATLALATMIAACGILLPGLFGVAGAMVLAQLARHLLTMFAGATIHSVYAGTLSRRAGGAIVACALLSILASIVWSGGAAPAGAAAWRAALPWLCAYGLFGAALLGRGWPMPRWIVGAGTISYSLYLWNLPVFSTIPQFGHWAVTTLVWFVVTIAIARATYRWIERPAIALGHRLTARRAGPGDPARPVLAVRASSGD